MPQKKNETKENYTAFRRVGKSMEIFVGGEASGRILKKNQVS